MKKLLLAAVLSLGFFSPALSQSPPHKLLSRATQSDANYKKDFAFWVKYSDDNIRDVKALSYFDTARPNMMLFVLTQPCNSQQAQKKTILAYNFFLMMRRFDYTPSAAKQCSVAVYNRSNKSITRCGENGIF